MSKESFTFGWVSPQINGNFAAWSNNKSEGTKEDADRFYNETAEKEQDAGQDWFCVEKEDRPAK